MSPECPDHSRPRPPGSRRVKRRALVAGGVCATLAVGTAVTVAGDAVRLPLALAVPRADVFGDDTANRPADGPGLNFLLVGIDRRAGMSAREKDRLHVNGEQCDCTDTMMLLHISADHRRVSTVSIPRDSYVSFPRPEETSRARTAATPGPLPRAGKINGAYKLGGPALTVRTVEAATGVRIDHYLEADFTRFVTAVDKLGGITVCTDERMRDKDSGLDLAPGTHRLDGRGALRYARARHIPPSGDLGRVRRQQRLIAETLDHFHRQGVLKDPVALARTAHALLGTLRADENLTTGRLRTLGHALRRLTSADAEFATVPIADFDHRVTDWGSTLKWDRKRADKLFAALREDRTITSERAYAQPAPGVPVDWAPGEIQLRVRAARGDAEAAAALERGLRANGFQVLRRLPAPTRGGPGAGTGTPTVIRYDPHWERQATTLAAALPDAELRPVEGHAQVFEVRLGSALQPVTRIVHDRSSVEGAPVTGDELDCDEPAAHRP